jgi:hypothetical protein
MNRREAIIQMALAMGGTMLGPRLLAAALDPSAVSRAGWAAADLALLDEIGDTIIPATDTPGAKAVGIGAFIAMMVDDCYVAADQAAFRTGLTQLAATYQARQGRAFVGGSAETRTALLNELDREQRAYTTKKQRTDPTHYFRMLKELTVIGYFTSEIGATKAARYVESPGSYNGSLPYKKGDRVWAT